MPYDFRGRLFRHRPRKSTDQGRDHRPRTGRRPEEPALEGYLCVCDQEWCWCPEQVRSPDTACVTCAAGRHVGGGWH